MSYQKWLGNVSTVNYFLGGLIFILFLSLILSSSPGEYTNEAASQADAASVHEQAAQCRQDIQCWGRQHLAEATGACVPYIEASAKYDYKWTAGLFGLRFSAFDWRQDSDAGIITYAGNQIKLQNGFGLFVTHSYQCDYDPESERVTDIRITPGRF